MNPEVNGNPIVTRIVEPARKAIIFGSVMTWGLLILPAVSSALRVGTIGSMVLSMAFCALVPTAGALLSFGVAERLLRQKILKERRRTEELADRLRTEENTRQLAAAGDVPDGDSD